MLRILAPGLEVTKAMRHTFVEAARAKLIAANDPTIKVRRFRGRVIATSCTLALNVIRPRGWWD
jgi:hypothetical protein